VTHSKQGVGESSVLLASYTPMALLTEVALLDCLRGRGGALIQVS
jgi:hypothetical protein